MVKAVHTRGIETFPQLSDVGRLLEQIARKDESAMTELYYATVAMARLYIRRFVYDSENAEEVVQDVYWHIWIHAPVYNASRGTPRAWLFMIMRSRAIDSIRRTRRGAPNVDLSDDPGVGNTGGATSTLQEMWRVQLIRTTLARLSASEHRLIQLAFFDGCTHVEIARQTGVPLGTVRTRIRRALAAIREVLPSKMETVW